MPFKYLVDPLFLSCFTAYWLNRFLESAGWSPTVCRFYLNDVVCIPFWIPIMLWVQRVLGLRSSDEIPQAMEIVIPLVLWAVIFEIILPMTHTFSGLTVADANDVFCYSLGAVFAQHFWHWWYRR